FQLHHADPAGVRGSHPLQEAEGRNLDARGTTGVEDRELLRDLDVESVDPDLDHSFLSFLPCGAHFIVSTVFGHSSIRARTFFLSTPNDSAVSNAPRAFGHCPMCRNSSPRRYQAPPSLGFRSRSCERMALDSSNLRSSIRLVAIQ